MGSSFVLHIDSLLKRLGQVNIDIDAAVQALQARQPTSCDCVVQQLSEYSGLLSVLLVSLGESISAATDSALGTAHSGRTVAAHANATSSTGDHCHVAQ